MLEAVHGTGGQQSQLGQTLSAAFVGLNSGKSKIGQVFDGVARELVKAFVCPCEVPGGVNMTDADGGMVEGFAIPFLGGNDLGVEELLLGDIADDDGGADDGAVGVADGR